MKRNSVILTVDRNHSNLELLDQCLSQEGYQILKATNLEMFDQALLRSKEIDLALVDIAGFDQGIWLGCERLRNQRIPFLVLSPRQSTAVRRESFARGALNILVKPLAVRELLGIIQNLPDQPK